MPDLVIS